MIRTTVGTLRNAIRRILAEANKPGTCDKQEFLYYVVSHGGMLIESGWEDPMEADAAAVKLSGRGLQSKVYTRRELAKEGLDPSIDGNWHGSCK